MKIDLHTHTIFSDGRDSAEEMVLAAIEKGLDVIGISDHSYTPFDPGYCMNSERYEEYIETIRKLKEKYKDQIKVLCGIELDLFSDVPSQNFDYIIGSVHYVKVNEEYLPIDLDAETFENIIHDHFKDDPYAFAEAYYETLQGLYEKTHCDIVGHFDLIAKFNEGSRFFDETEERYVRAWKKAMEKLVRDVKCFEVNHGAFNKGLRSVPYLTEEMRAHLKMLGGTFIFSSDSHTRQTIGKF